MSLADTHCHLDDEKFDSDRDAAIERAFEAGVTQIVAVGTGDGPPDLEAGIRLAGAHRNVYATVGVHPHDASKADDGSLRRLEELLKHKKVIAIGEIGLDYHYDFSPRDRQRAMFVEQMRIARDARKPIVVHTREAWDDTLVLLAEHWAPSGLGGIMHCFTGGTAQAAQCLQLGFHLSFAGILTFPKAVEIRAAAAMCPIDRLLVETDAPYLAPVPHRGKRNEPAFVVHTAQVLAGLRGVTLEEVARLTTHNFDRLCLPENRDSGYTETIPWDSAS